MGVAPSGLLAGALVHGATDTLLAVTLAKSLPVEADFWVALGALRTLCSPQPLPVLRAQAQLLHVLRALEADPAESEPETAPGAPGRGLVLQRLERLQGFLDDQLREAEAGLVECQAGG